MLQSAISAHSSKCAWVARTVLTATVMACEIVIAYVDLLQPEFLLFEGPRALSNQTGIPLGQAQAVSAAWVTSGLLTGLLAVDALVLWLVAGCLWGPTFWSRREWLVDMLLTLGTVLVMLLPSVVYQTLIPRFRARPSVGGHCVNNTDTEDECHSSWSYQSEYSYALGPGLYALRLLLLPTLHSMIKEYLGLLRFSCETGPHMVHSHTVHLPLGALLIPCNMCGTGASSSPRRSAHRPPPSASSPTPRSNGYATSWRPSRPRWRATASGLGHSPNERLDSARHPLCHWPASDPATLAPPSGVSQEHDAG